MAVRGRARYFSVTEASYNIESSGQWKNILFLKLECQSGVRTRNHRLSKQAALTTAPGMSYSAEIMF